MPTFMLSQSTKDCLCSRLDSFPAALNNYLQFVTVVHVNLLLLLCLSDFRITFSTRGMPCMTSDQHQLQQQKNVHCAVHLCSFRACILLAVGSQASRRPEKARGRRRARLPRLLTHVVETHSPSPPRPPPPSLSPPDIPPGPAPRPNSSCDQLRSGSGAQ